MTTFILCCTSFLLIKNSHCVCFCSFCFLISQNPFGIYPCRLTNVSVDLKSIAVMTMFHNVPLLPQRWINFIQSITFNFNRGLNYAAPSEYISSKEKEIAARMLLQFHRAKITFGLCYFIV